MSYAAQSDLLNRVTAVELVALTDDTKSGEVNAAIVQTNLDRATGLIDSYVRTRYQTPLQASNTITEICVDIALYYLYTRRPQKMKETVRQGYEDALGILKDISSGKGAIDQPATATVPQTSSTSAVKPRSQHAIFGERNMEGFT